MRKHYAALFAVALTALASIGDVQAQDKSSPSGAAPATVRSGVRDFDFEFGNWRVHHRVKRASGEWVVYDGTCTTHGLMGGAGNVEEHTFNKPDGVTYGVALRAYDAKTGQWAIWWVDGRNPHGPLDPPTVGHFENGLGTFYWDGVVNGKPLRTRF